MQNLSSISPNLRRAGKYLLFKALLIGITIILGVFVTVLIANKSNQLEQSVQNQIERYLRTYTYQNNLRTSDPSLQNLRAELEAESGLTLSFWPRHALWTWNALRFDWGRLVIASSMPVYGQARNDVNVRDILLSYFPNTLLLAVAANFLIFTFGIPLSLYLARNYGNLLDRAIAILSPISSVPSWAIGVLLISIFAVELGWLPTGGMFDKLPPETALGYLPIVLKRMILPVSAIFLSLFFQLVTSWRTFFVIYSQEDYVDLGKAQGLPSKKLEHLYILKPALPYVITSFSMTLVGFWQMTMALEVIFDWPGIGWLYIEKALPNFWGESMYPGELLLAVGVVVMFAYLLGMVVFLLDIVYTLVDPRVHLETEQLSQLKKKSWKFWQTRPTSSKLPAHTFRQPHPTAQSPQNSFQKELQIFFKNFLRGIQRTMVEISRYPSAILGFFLISLLIIGSFYAITAYPYEKIGREWGRQTLTGKPTVPQLAQPTWVNFFRTEKYLSILKLESTQGQAQKQVRQISESLTEINLTYTFDYSYADFPSEIYLYVASEFDQKQPYLTVTWITPDGHKITPKGQNPTSSTFSYNFTENLPARRLVSQNPSWQNWFTFGNINPTPIHYILFAESESPNARPQKGSYTVIVSGLFFEPKNNLEADLVLLGQVYGLAGTDFMRRDLLIPLLWGMPFALAFGLFGATVTTLFSMFLAAGSAWYGGWVDTLIQRLTEANMILPVLAISVLAYALFSLNIWVVLAIIVGLNIFGSPTKTFRAAFLQVKEAPYIEAARAYGASHLRIILAYMIPRIIPVIVPQLITLIPTFVFLEATLGIFNIKSDYPTWGTIIYQGLTRGALYGPRFWVLEPLALLLMTSLAFALLGSALERILNPRLQS